MKKIKILDCTLRDGGYYNNWDFPKDLVDNYLGAMSKIGVDYVELGFRSFEKKGFRGPNWYTTENYLNNLVIPKNINVSVMVNASELISHSLGCLKATKLMFVSRKKSKIKLVRLACHFQEFEKTTKICELLKSMGYLVAINLMQISEQSKEKILSVAKIAQEIKPDILYFADSLGGMATSTISDLVETFRTYWQGNLGIHTHNNLGRAVENSLAAMNLGVSFIDSTVTGMGRGPGNAQTEYLLVDIQNTRQKKLNILLMDIQLISNQVNNNCFSNCILKNFFNYFFFIYCIKCASCFIKNYYIRVVIHRPCYSYSLLLSSRYSSSIFS